MLQLKNVGLDYASGKTTVHALRRINLTLPSAGLILITGGALSGKTALLRILAGTDLPSRGEILVDGENTAHWNEERRSAWRRRVGIADESLLLPDRTLGENAALSARLAGWQESDCRSKASAALALFAMEELRSRLPGELSRQERTLGALCCAMAREPELLLVDEPGDGVDTASRGSILSVLRRAAADRLVAVFSRDEKLFDGGEDMTLVLTDGEITAQWGELGARTAVTPPAGLSFSRRFSASLGNLCRPRGRAGARLGGVFCAVLAVCLALSALTGLRQRERDLQAETLAAYPIVLTPNSVPAGELSDLADYLEREMDIHSASLQRTWAIAPRIYALNAAGDVTLVSPDTQTGTGLWSELPDGDTLQRSGYELVAGRWPSRYDEAAVLLDSQGGIDRACLQALGLTSTDAAAGIGHTDLLRLSFRVMVPTGEYVKNVDGTWGYIGNDPAMLSAAVKSALPLKIVGVLRPAGNIGRAGVGGAVYLGDLTRWVINSVRESAVVKEQMSSPAHDVLTGQPFDPTAHETEPEAQRQALHDYFVSLRSRQQAALAGELTGFEVEESAAQDTLLHYLDALTDQEVSALYQERIESLVSPSSLEYNLRAFGVLDSETLTGLRLYAGTFAARGELERLIALYPQRVVYSDDASSVMAAGAAVMESADRTVGVLGPLVCILGALGVLLASVLPVAARRRETAVLRILGLSGSGAASVLGLESLILGILGSAAGTLLALVLLRFTGGELFGGVEWVLPWQTAAVTGSAAALLAGISGRLAAGGLSRRSPGEALRCAE